MKLKKLLKKLYENSFICICNDNEATKSIRVNAFVKCFKNTDVMKLKVDKLCATTAHDYDQEQDKFIHKYDFISIKVKANLKTIRDLSSMINSTLEREKDNTAPKIKKDISILY